MPIAVFSKNQGGIDVGSSPLSIADGNATGQSYNYEYAKTGAITKDLGSRQINTSPDAQLVTLGLGIHHDVATDARTVVRAAGTKIQTVNISTGVMTNLHDDTVTASTNFLSSGSTQPVVFAPFNTLTGGTQLWMSGGGLTLPEGYTGTNVTQNGTPAPTGSIAPVVNAHAGGTFITGTYFYGLQYRKLGTQVFSNVALDASATVVNTDDKVTITFTLTNNDTTRYDQIWVWRSAVGGVSGFTTGSIIAKLASTATNYIDTGTSIVDSENVARAGNTVLDNSTLGSATYNYITTFKRRLVVATESTFYLSDLNKPESWPIGNSITIPSGGPITGLASLGIPSEYTTGAEEYLVIFKEREMWILTGLSIDDWDLKQVDKTGCESQSLIVPFNGFLSWLGFNGVFIWDGKGRPSRISRPIYSLFADDGDLDVAKLVVGYGAYYEQKNQVIWRVSNRTKGTNQFTIKIDVRNTNEGAGLNLQNPEMSGVFIFGSDANTNYGLVSLRLTNKTEQLLAGDNLGNIFQTLSSPSVPVAFTYETKPFDMGRPETLKHFKRVLVWIERITTNDLTMYFWADYRNRDEYRSKVVSSMSPTKGTQPALWDIALWDQAFWDDYTPDISPIEFNLHQYENNCVGTSLKLRFEQLEAGAPVRIHAFAIEWEEVGNLPIPTQQI